MSKFIKAALKYYYTVFVFGLFILILGIVAIFFTPIDIFPEINTPAVVAVWNYNGMPAKDVENRIVSIAERAYSANMNDVEHIESQSLYGVGVIKVFLHPGADVNTAITQLSSASQVALNNMPLGIRPPQVVKYTPTTIPVLQVVVSSKTIPLLDVSDLAQNIIKVQMSKVEGSQIPLPMGGLNRQIMVDLDMQKMEARALTPLAITDTLAEQNVILPSGNAKIGGFDYYITLNNATRTIDEMNKFPIKSKEGETVYLRDIAYIHNGNAVQENVVRHDGVAGSLMTVYKAGKTSTIKVVDGCKKIIPIIKKIVPSEIQMNELFDQSIFVKSSIHSVIFEGTLAAILTALMILLFLGSKRSTFIVAVSIPLSILFAIICLALCGQTLNIMTLSGMALAIGMLVDNSTVVLENILRNKEIYKNRITLQEIICKSASEVAIPTLVSTLSICMVFAPIFLMKSATKFLFAPMALSVICAMIGSYLLSNTIVPVMVDKLLKKTEVLKTDTLLYNLHETVNKSFAKLRRVYKQFLVKQVMRNPKKTLQFSALVIAISFCLLPFIGENFFPSVDAGQIRLHVYAQHGTRIEDTARAFSDIEKTIKTVIPEKEIDTMLDNIGIPVSMLNLAFMDNSQLGMGDGEILISLKKHHKPTQKYIKKLRKVLNEKYPNMTFFFQSADMVGKILNFGLASPIDVQIQGEDTKGNYALAIKMLEDIKKVKGVADAHVHQITDYPEIKLEVDKIKAANMGLTQADVAKNMIIALSSSAQAMPAYWVDPENGVNYLLALQVPPYWINSVSDVMDVPLAFNGNKPIRLSNVATIHESTAPSVVNHYDIMPVYDILINIQDRDLDSVADDIHNIVKKYEKQAPNGTFINILGQANAMKSAFSALLSGLLLALVLVYLLIVTNFQSWRNPFIIITPVPMALAGILWMLYATDTTFSIQAMMGSIMAIGVSCSNSILVVSFATDKMKKGFNSVRAAVDAGFTRIRPVIMTAFAMILGMLPMSLGLGEGGEQNAPIGRTVIGGLLFATFATLVIVPMLFAIMNKNKKYREEYGL